MVALSIGYSYSSSLLSELIGVPQSSNVVNSSRRKTNVVYCQGGGNVIKSSGLSSVLTERSSLVGTDNAATTLMEAGSLVLSQNGKTQAEIAVKDLVPYGGPTTLIGLEDGTGIVKFLRGKKFFITGATGFLAKGISVKYNQVKIISLQENHLIKINFKDKK